MERGFVVMAPGLRVRGWSLVGIWDEKRHRMMERLLRAMDEKRGGMGGGRIG